MRRRSASVSFASCERASANSRFAEAKAALRVQLPLNLFKDFGLTIGAQAVAQAAAGIEVGLGLAIGDFIALLRENPESEGLPIELVVLLLHEPPNREHQLRVLGN